MSTDFQPAYVPTVRFDNTNGLSGTHFRFNVGALPDLSFFVQSVAVPTLTIASVNRVNPFIDIREVGDHIAVGGIEVHYLVDSTFKTYSSLYWWIKGYGFPKSYDEVRDFRAARTARLAIPSPKIHDLEKTNATLQILQPDTEQIIVELQFLDVFPTTLGGLEFATTSPDADAALLKTMVTFSCTTFDVVFA